MGAWGGVGVGCVLTLKANIGCRGGSASLRRFATVNCST